MAGLMISSEGDSIECWENYTAGEVMVQGLAGQIHQQDVEAIVRAQKQMLQRFEKTNEMLSNCNGLSASRYAAAQQEFSKYSTMLLQTKKDLDYIFKKIRIMRTKLELQYPQAVAAVAEQLKEIDEQEEGDEIQVISKQLPTQQHVSSSPPRCCSLGADGCGESCVSTESSEHKSVTGGAGAPSSSASCRSGDSSVLPVVAARDKGGEEKVHDEGGGELDEDYEEAIRTGKVKSISGKLHHVSSSDSSTSSAKSSCSSSDS